MHTTNLRKVGGSVMLAVPPVLLEGDRLIVAPRTRPRYSLDELLAMCDEMAPADAGGREWLDSQPVGSELL